MNAIELADTKPAALMRTATDIAGLCREIVMKRAISIKGKKYVKVEEWCTIASLWGAIPSIQSVTVEDTGIKAVCELKTHTGQVLATAEGYVGNDEEMWQKRPLFARRAMAQTRAISRVCRTAYAFVIPMIDAGLSTTPAEEMMGIDDEAPAPKVVSAPVIREVVDVETGQVALIPEEPPPSAWDPDTGPAAPVVMPFGSAKGQPPSALDAKSLAWYRKVARENVADPDKSRFRSKNEELLAALDAEFSRRKKGAAQETRIAAAELGSDDPDPLPF